MGDFKKAGREWQPTAEPERVRVHDFPGDAVGKAIPYGVYDMRANEAWSASGATMTRRPSPSRRSVSGGR